MPGSNDPRENNPVDRTPLDQPAIDRLRPAVESHKRVLNILAIEDNPADLKLLKTYLDGLPFNLTGTDRLAKGLKLIDGQAFDAILLDLSLPDAQGIDTFYELHCHAPHIPILVLTGLDDETVGSEAVQAGAQDYLVKGQLPPALLGRAIRYAVERHQSEIKMKELNDSLERRVSQLAAANQELDNLAQALALSSEQAIQASNFKSQFVARISHDLRSPISGVIGITELMLKNDRPADTAETRRFIELIDEAAKSQLLLLNDILDLSKIEAGKVELNNVDFCPVKLLEDIGQLFAASAASKGVTLMTYIDRELQPALHGDPDRLREILINFTNNAIKFTPQGEVVLRAVRESEDENYVRVRFSVSDTGPGIAEDIQKHLFEPFVQSKLSKKHGGTGLGLSICKRLVQLMDGQIGAETKAGKGSTFWFSVRLRRSKESGPDNRLFLSQLLASYLPNVRVLVADDNSTNREIVLRYIESVGWRCDGSAASAPEALELLHQARDRNDKYTAAIIDLENSTPNSFQLAEEIQKDPTLSEIPLVLLAGVDQNRKGALAWQAGFSAYLTKPIKQANLLDCVAELSVSANLRKETALEAEGEGRNSDESQGQEETVIRALVAEDNPTARMALVKQLEELGVQVDAVDNGQEAVAAVAAHDYALVFMDCDMPIMSGVEATKIIRKLYGQKIVILATTGGEHMSLCSQAGMNGFFTKPIRREQLSEIIKNWKQGTRRNEII